MTALGIDIASFQGSPNFKDVKAAGYRFVYAKSTQGTHYLSPEYRAQREGAVQAQLYFGTYHYAEAKHANPLGEAAHFLASSHFEPYHLVPFLDLEEVGSEGASPTTLEDYAFRWGDYVRKHLGVKRLVLYADLNMLRYRVKVTARLRQLYLLDVAYPTTGPAPKVPGWDLAFHQFDWHGHVPGVSGGVDRDRALVDLHALTIDQMKAGSPPQPKPPPKTPLLQRLRYRL